jgi:preprotein translocase subunit SecA
MRKAEEIAADFADERTLPEDWDHKGLSDAVFKQYNFRLAPFDKDTLDGLTAEGLAQDIYEQAMAVYAQREKSIGPDTLRHLERVVMLQTVDNLWKDHLLSMDHLKEGIGLRGYAQQNPLLVYKKEGFEMFQETHRPHQGRDHRHHVPHPAGRTPKEQNLTFSGGGDSPAAKKPVKRASEKIGRNDPCPCGSGKKYKKCCGR